MTSALAFSSVQAAGGIAPNQPGMTVARREWELGPFHIIRRLDLRPQEQVVKVVIDFFLPRWLADPLTRAILIDMMRHTAGHWIETGAQGVNDQRLRCALLEIFRLGLLVPVGHKVERDSGGSASAQPVERPKPASLPKRAPKVEKTWIEFRLVDQMQRAVAGARYRLKLTDGSVREGQLDEGGQLRIAGIQPGTCQICFLDFAAKEWRRL